MSQPKTTHDNVNIFLHHPRAAAIEMSPIDALRHAHSVMQSLSAVDLDKARHYVETYENAKELRYLLKHLPLDAESKPDTGNTKADDKGTDVKVDENTNVEVDEGTNVEVDAKPTDSESTEPDLPPAPPSHDVHDVPSTPSSTY